MTLSIGNKIICLSFKHRTELATFRADRCESVVCPYPHQFTIVDKLPSRADIAATIDFLERLTIILAVLKLVGIDDINSFAKSCHPQLPLVIFRYVIDPWHINSGCRIHDHFRQNLVVLTVVETYALIRTHPQTLF